MILSHQRLIINGLLFKDWKKAWRKSIEWASQDYTTTTTTTAARLWHRYYSDRQDALHLLRLHHKTSLLILQPSSLLLRCEDDVKNALDWRNAVALKAQRRWIQSHAPFQKFGPVRPTKSQRDRTKLMVHYRKGLHWHKILQMFHEQNQDYGLIELATTLSQLTKYPSFQSNHPNLPPILEVIAQRIETSSVIDPRCYSNICHSIAKLRIDDDSTRRIFNHMSSAMFAKAFIDEGNPHDISNVAWSFARLQRPDLMNNLLQQMDDHCRNSLFTGKPQAPAIILWACATLGQSSPELVATMERHVDWMLSKGDAQNVSNTAWACATMGFTAPALFEAIDRGSQGLVGFGDPQSVADTAWACAKLGHASPAFFAAIAKRSNWLVTKGTPQGISNTAWACAKLGYASSPLFKAIQGRSEWLVSEGDVQATSNTAWACARLGHTTPALFVAVENHAERLISQGTTQTIANTAWACGKLGHASTRFFAALDHRAEWLVAHGQVQEIVNTACSSARLRHPSPTLFAAIANRWDWLLEKGNKQDMDGTLWAFKRLNHPLPDDSKPTRSEATSPS